MEQRWFFVLFGTFAIDLVKIDDWDNINPDIAVEKIILQASEDQILYIPKGYGTAIQALEPRSELLVFADHGINNIKNDDFTWPVDYFVRRQKL